MRTFVQQQKPAQQAKLVGSSTHTRPRLWSSECQAVQSILHLQRTIGNQSVQRLLKGQNNSRTNEGAILSENELTHASQQNSDAATNNEEGPQHTTREDDVRKRKLDVSRLRGQPQLQREPSEIPRLPSPSNKGTAVLRSIAGKIKLRGNEYELKNGKLYSPYINIQVGRVRTSATSIPAGKLPTNMQYTIWLRAGSMFRGMLLPFHAGGDLLKDAENGSTFSIVTRWRAKLWRKSAFGWETIRSRDYYKKAKRKSSFIDKAGGPTIEATLKRLYTIVDGQRANKAVIRGKPTLTKENAKVVRAVAHAECSGKIGCINTYEDYPILSVGFKQVTLRFNSLQKTIKNTQSAFRKHGIELETGFYQIGKDKFQKIKGVSNPQVLRRSEWALKFYAASMEDDVVKELVRQVLKTKQSIVTQLKSKPSLAAVSIYLKDAELVAILTQLRNNCPKCSKIVLRYSYAGRKNLKRWAMKVKRKESTYGQFLQQRKFFLQYLRNSIIRRAYRKAGHNQWIGVKIWDKVHALYKNYRPLL